MLVIHWHFKMKAKFCSQLYSSSVPHQPLNVNPTHMLFLWALVISYPSFLASGEEKLWGGGYHTDSLDIGRSGTIGVQLTWPLLSQWSPGSGTDSLCDSKYRNFTSPTLAHVLFLLPGTVPPLLSSPPSCLACSCPYQVTALTSCTPLPSSLCHLPIAPSTCLLVTPLL